MHWREAEAAFEHPVIGETTLGRMFEDSADRNPTGVAQRYKGGAYDRSLVGRGALPAAPPGEFAALTYREMRDVVRTLAAGFRDLGVEPGDRVGLFSHTRMEWAQADFALLAAGASVATVYPTATEAQVAHVLGDSGAAGVVVEDATALRRTLAVEDDLSLSFVVVIDDPADGSGMAGTLRDRPDVLTLGDLHERGRAAYDPDAYERWLDERALDDPASIVYTSGTTGTPKGVELTHGNFRANVNQTFRRFGPRPDRTGPRIDTDSVALSFLPLAHVFERLAGHYLLFAAGATVAYAESSDTLREDFGLVRPTMGTSVPRVYEKLYDAARSEASGSALSARIFEWAVGVGRRHHETDDPGFALSLSHRIADRLVFARVREALGGRVEFLISGGGSLSADLCARFHGMGLPVLEGYGLTETAPVVSVNPMEAPEVGTIGPPLPGVEVRVDPRGSGDIAAEQGGEVGELLVRGPNVTPGYWHLPAATEAAFEASDAGDPWLRTGDIVERRADGYLVFRERAKRLLKLSTGKMVAPGPIEDAFAASPLIEQVLVVGDGRRFVSALVVPRFEGLAAWAKREGIDLPDDPAARCLDERVRERVQREVDAVNESLEPHERIKRVRLVPEAFTEENRLLTPTMKKRRRAILDRYADDVDLVYERA